MQLGLYGERLTTKNMVTISDFAYYAVNVNVAVTVQWESSLVRNAFRVR